MGFTDLVVSITFYFNAPENARPLQDKCFAHICAFFGLGAFIVNAAENADDFRLDIPMSRGQNLYTAECRRALEHNGALKISLHQVDVRAAEECADFSSLEIL